MTKLFTFFVLSLMCAHLFAQNRAIDLDGADDYVAIPENASLPTTALTVEVWFNPSAVTNSSVLISKGVPASASYFTLHCGSTDLLQIHAWQAGSYLSFDMFTTGGGNRLFYQLPANLAGTWHHAAITYDGLEKRLYLDGALVGQQALSGTILTDAGSPLLIGNLAQNFANPFKGLVDEVRIWSVARTATEISVNRNMEIPSNTAGLAAYYKFNQGIANENNAGLTTVTDVATVPHNGNLMNFALNGSTSNWVGGYPALVVLPIKFSSFTASKLAGTINLDWRTSIQRDVLSFEIERSADGQTFTKIGSVPVRQVREDEQSYQYIDRLPLTGNNYYRIKTLENSGRFTYTKILVVKMNSLASLSVYPNPSTDVLLVQTMLKGKFTVRIQDAMQRVVKTFQLTSNGSLLVSSIDVSNLPKGVYVLHAGDDVLEFVKQ